MNGEQVEALRVTYVSARAAVMALEPQFDAVVAVEPLTGSVPAMSDDAIEVAREYFRLAIARDVALANFQAAVLGQ